MIKLKSLILENISDTANFKSWFGDSKVVDEKGNPLVVYHYTTKGGFYVFKPSSHFGTRNQTNSYYKSFIPFDKSGNPIKLPKKPSIYPVYIRIENPKRLPDCETSWGWEIRNAKKEGYDGLIYRNGFEPDIEWGETEHNKFADSYIVFEPTQIKSAIGNNGRFDSDNPDIMKENSYAGSCVDVDSGRNYPICNIFNDATDMAGVVNPDGHNFVQVNSKDFFDNIPRRYVPKKALVGDLEYYRVKQDRGGNLLTNETSGLWWIYNITQDIHYFFTK